jgi:hypothetical protein
LDRDEIYLCRIERNEIENEIEEADFEIEDEMGIESNRMESNRGE